MATNFDESDDRELSRQLDRAQELPRDLMLLKMENESIMALARTKPRDQADIIRQLTAVIEAYPAAADEAIYCKPVGQTCECQCAKCKHRYEVAPKDRDRATCPRCECRDCDYKNNVQKYAENLSIRAAETIRSIYGMNRLATSTEELPDGKVRVSGTFIDYATGTMTSDERIVSPWYKSRYGNGGMERTPEDRFLSVTVKAEKSKLRRDLILDAVPAITKAMYRDLCEKKIAESVTEGTIEESVLPTFAKYGLSAEQVESIVGRPRSLGWTQGELLTLKKVAVSLKNGELTVAELVSRLGEQDAAKDSTPASATGAVSGSDFAKPKGRKKADKPVEQTTEAETKPTVQETPATETQPVAEDDKTTQETLLPEDAEDAEPGTGRNTDAAMDEEMYAVLASRVARCQTVADCNAVDAEQKRFDMTAHQRARIVLAIKAKRGEVGK